MNPTDETIVRRIRTMNDNFRTTFVGGLTVFSQAVAELPLDLKARAILAVQAFDAFDADNDPYHQHDFGSFQIAGETYLFKIDHYNLIGGLGGSRRPTSHHARIRILTVTTATEMTMANQQADYRAYTVIKREGQDDYWLALGAAFAHKAGDADGFNVILQALPLPSEDGTCKIVLRRPRSESDERPVQRDEPRNSRPQSNNRSRR
jgi:hypothetical protein